MKCQTDKPKQTKLNKAIQVSQSGVKGQLGRTSFVHFLVEYYQKLLYI